MNLDDYINKIKNPPKYKPEMKFCAMQMGYFGNIPPRKMKMIEDVYKHFREDAFRDIRDIYKANEDTGWFFQSESVNGNRGIVSMAIGSTYGTYDEYIKQISQEDFNERYNSCKKAGSQKIAYIKILTKKDGWDSINDKYMYIFYDSTGDVFMDEYATDIVNSWSEEKLGEALARECIELDESKKRVRQIRLTHR